MNIAPPPATVMQISVADSCPFVNGFLKMGAPNDSTEVAKLQYFLKEREGLDADQSGIFDEKTKAAVEAFQRKYMADVMGPWGATRPTGTVFITTVRKINQLACGSPLSLDPDEASMVEDYKRAALAAEAQQSFVPPSTIPPSTASQDTAAAQDAVPVSSSTSPALGKRLWSFLKSFFVR